MKERQAGPGIHELSEREKATILEFRDLVTQSLVTSGARPITTIAPLTV